MCFQIGLQFFEYHLFGFQIGPHFLIWLIVFSDGSPFSFTLFTMFQIAASGGYMMACVADWLVVAPFAMLGSIGVLGGIPNFNKALKRAGVDYYHFTAGLQTCCDDGHIKFTLFAFCFSFFSCLFFLLAVAISRKQLFTTRRAFHKCVHAFGVVHGIGGTTLREFFQVLGLLLISAQGILSVPVFLFCCWLGSTATLGFFTAGSTMRQAGQDSVCVIVVVVSAANEFRYLQRVSHTSGGVF